MASLMGCTVDQSRRAHDLIQREPTAPSSDVQFEDVRVRHPRATRLPPANCMVSGGQTSSPGARDLAAH